MNRSLGVVLGCVGLAAACSGRPQCAADEVARDGACRAVCNSTVDCTRSDQCIDGACMPAGNVTDGGISASGVPDGGEASSSRGTAGSGSSTSLSSASSVDAGSADAGPPAARCDDETRNGAESDVDCGGGTCPGCITGKACQRHSDCASGYCPAGSCVVPDPLALSPASVTLDVGGEVTFSPSGGIAPYQFSVPLGGGTIDPTRGAYVAPATPGTATVRVTDAAGNMADAAVSIVEPLQVSPSTSVLVVDTSFTFVASGGVPPYLWSVANGGGNITNGGLYTAPAAAGNATVRVIDSLGDTADAAVTIADALQISPTTAYLQYSTSLPFTAVGGVPPYAWSVVSGGGAITSDGTYTAPAGSGTATVRVTDSLGATSDATVTIYFPLAVQPVRWTMVLDTTKNFYANNGVSPFTWSMVSGTGNVVSSGMGNYIGTFTAPTAPGSATIRVTDATGGASDATVTFDAASFTYTQTGIIPWETSPGSPRCPCDTIASVQNCPTSFVYADIGPKCYDMGYGVDDDDVEYTRSP